MPLFPANSRQEEQMRAQAAAEARRQEAEREEREKRRHASELAAMRERHLKERMALISQSSHGKKVLQKLDEEVRWTRFDDYIIPSRGWH